MVKTNSKYKVFDYEINRSLRSHRESSSFKPLYYNQYIIIETKKKCQMNILCIIYVYNYIFRNDDNSSSQLYIL